MSRELTSEEQDLWERFTKDMHPLCTQTPATHKSSKTRVNTNLERQDAQENPQSFESFEDLLKSNNESFIPLKSHAPVLHSSSTPITPKGRNMAHTKYLDLHGYTEREAYAHIVSFLENAQKYGKKHVRIITGKSGILFQYVPKWLHALKHLVVSFHPAPRHQGGDGALIVWVSRQPR